MIARVCPASALAIARTSMSNRFSFVRRETAKMKSPYSSQR